MVFATRCRVLILAVLVTTAAHNVSSTPSGRRDLAEINRELTATGLADDMAQLKARKPPRQIVRRVLSHHVLVDYYDDHKLHQLPGGSTYASTMFQVSGGGDAPGSSGRLKVTDRRSGRVAFESQDTGDDQAKVWYVKPVQEAAHKLPVLQVSGVISSPSSASPESMPSLWDVMLKNGCGSFAELVAATAGATATYNKSTDGGLTVFCPADKALEAFEPTFNKHKAGARLKLLLYHAVKGHYSIRALKVNNGAMSTLATDGNGMYDLIVDNDGDNVTLLSAAREAAIVVRTLMDDNRLVVHMINAVLLPNDFAEPGPADANAPSSATNNAGDGRQESSATNPPLQAAFASTVGVIVVWVWLVSMSTF